MSLFKLRGSLSRGQAILLGIAGLIIFLVIWWLMAEAFAIEREVTDIQLDSNPTSEETVALETLQDSDPLPNLVPEDAPEGTYCGIRVSVPGLDSNLLSLRLEDSAGSLFRLNPKTGAVYVTDVGLDYESTTVHTIVVSGSATDGRSFSSNFIIQVGDRNESTISKLEDVDPDPNEVSQKAGYLAPTGLTAFAEDPDGTDAVQYRLLDDGGVFGIDRESGQVVVEDTASLHRRGIGSIGVTVVASSEDFSADTARFSLQVISAVGDSAAVAGPTKVYPILPTPGQVIRAYPSLVKDDALARNTFKSIWLNMQGYFWAVLLSVPIGFIIGLFPMFRGLFSKQVDALRYLPLTALTGLFIIWFGIEDQMKIAFLAFGIIVYLLPVVVQRIDEVQRVYTQTVFTLGANSWQTIRSVYIPSVMSKVIDDIRVLTAISWTYIIIAELLNREEGIGSLIYIKARQGQIDKVFSILLVIILIGFLQDRIFVYIDKRLFPHKYDKSRLDGLRETEYGIIVLLLLAIFAIAQSIWLPGLENIMGNLAYIIGFTALIIIGYGELKLFRARKQLK